MALPRLFRKLNTEDRELTQIQSNIEDVVGKTVKVPLLNGLLIKDVALSTSPLRLAHRLGRKPLGYFVVRASANATIYDTLDTEQQPELFLPLIASGSVTVTLWVF